jgi:nucleotidyltransferase substrate binding protein (TIGR01987 family)
MLHLDSFAQAVASLAGVAGKTEDASVLGSLDALLRRGLKAGVIQHFEFTYELAWKSVKRWLENNVTPECGDGVTRKELFRLAQESRLLDDVETWMQYHRARHLTSHTYVEEVAEEVNQMAVCFVPVVQDLLTRLEARND